MGLSSFTMITDEAQAFKINKDDNNLKNKVHKIKPSDKLKKLSSNIYYLMSNSTRNLHSKKH